ncbi:Diacylglycerol kinase family enzyme (plasmid) [Deinococcus geothermalis DSM 11300]|uniref:Diacylglycerol kinase family enzyme n=2 Tax=Deinococcaceae TaxID=183710 RepID=Q1J2K2_DEIGD|nr:Diacylglycerol kinase family enzyme [Deinococcus geothermalis DSM 11300]
MPRSKGPVATPSPGPTPRGKVRDDEPAWGWSPTSDGPPMTNPDRGLKLLINANARRGRTAAPAAATALAAAGVHATPLLVDNFAMTEQLLRAEVARGTPCVVVGGGDGTLSHAANILRGTGTALGILPLGTGNTFARSVGVPLDLPGAARVIAEGRTVAVDVGLLNGRAFLNSVALGLSAQIARSLTENLKRRLGLLAWPVMGLQVLGRHRPLDLCLTSDQGSWQLRTHQLLVANGRYVAGPLRAAADASVTDQQLDVLVFGQGRLISLLRAGLGWTLGQPVLHVATGHLTVQLQGETTWASVDGEVTRLRTLALAVEAGSLLVRVPANFEARQV